MYARRTVDFWHRLSDIEENSALSEDEGTINGTRIRATVNQRRNGTRDKGTLSDFCRKTITEGHVISDSTTTRQESQAVL